MEDGGTLVFERIQPIIDETSVWISPDAVLLDTSKRKLIINPSNVTVYASDERVISRYEDNKWDIKYYDAAGALNFNLINNDVDKETAKRILYLALMFGEGKNGSLIGGATLQGILQSVVHLHKLWTKKDIPLSSGFSDRAAMSDAIHTLSASIIKKLPGLFLLLEKAGEYIDIYYKKDVQIEAIIRQKIQEFEQSHKQKAVIPVEIFVNSMNQRWEHIVKAENIMPQLESFIIQYQSNPSFGRSVAATGITRTEVISFYDAADIYNLNDFFSQYGISDIQKLANYITRLQCTSCHILYASSGMRHDEGKLLLIGCFREPTTTQPALIAGFEKKSGGKMRPQEWVTSNDIKRITDLNEKISKAMIHGLSIEQSTIPLFVTSTTLSYSIHKNRTKINPAELRIVQSNAQIELPLKKNQLILSKKMKEDFLEVIDPFRDWDNDKWIKINKPWRFTFHQYRRTFAVYALNSGLVSLTALQKQFAHLMMTATAYYGKGSYNFKSPIISNSKQHPKAMMEKEKGALDTLVFIRNVLLNKNIIEKSTNPWMKNHVKDEINDPEAFIQSNWKVIEKGIKNGMIFCKTTSLGKCFSIEPCDSHVTLNFTKCEDCSSAELDLKRINISIKEQEYITKIVMERSPDTPESQTEEMQLEWLKKLKKKVEG